jgi:hypothetical protein
MVIVGRGGVCFFERTVDGMVGTSISVGKKFTDSRRTGGCRTGRFGRQEVLRDTSGWLLTSRKRGKKPPSFSRMTISVIGGRIR